MIKVIVKETPKGVFFNLFKIVFFTQAMLELFHILKRKKKKGGEK